LNFPLALGRRSRWSLLCLNAKSRRSARCCNRLNSAATLIQRTPSEAPQSICTSLGRMYTRRRSATA
jgi:hypothetical protein